MNGAVLFLYVVEIDVHAAFLLSFIATRPANGLLRSTQLVFLRTWLTVDFVTPSSAAITVPSRVVPDLPGQLHGQLGFCPAARALVTPGVPSRLVGSALPWKLRPWTPVQMLNAPGTATGDNDLHALGYLPFAQFPDHPAHAHPAVSVPHLGNAFSLSLPVQIRQSPSSVVRREVIRGCVSCRCPDAVPVGKCRRNPLLCCWDAVHRRRPALASAQCSGVSNSSLPKYGVVQGLEGLV